MAYYITEEHKTIFKDVLEKLRSDIGRVVLIVKEKDTHYMRDCPNCGRDQITGKSNYRYSPTTPYPSDVVGPKPFRDGTMCPVCRGEGQIEISGYSQEQIRAKAFIQWFTLENKKGLLGSSKDAIPPGIVENLDCRLKFNNRYYGDVNDADYFLVDGIKVYSISTPVQRGLGDLSQLVIYCSKNYEVRQAK